MRTIICIVAAITLFGANLAGAQPALAHTGHGHGCGTGCAIGTLAAGVALGAALSSDRAYAAPYPATYGYAPPRARYVDPRLARIMAGLSEACSAGDDLSCARLARLAGARSGYGAAAAYSAVPAYSGYPAYGSVGYGSSYGYGSGYGNGYSYGASASNSRTTVVIQNQGGEGRGSEQRYQKYQNS